MRINFKRYFLYLIRWQLSTPILAVVLYYLASTGELLATVVANFIGGLIFFWVDMFIFTSSKLGVQWDVAEDVLCKDCGKQARGYRLVKTMNYDKSKTIPEFRCENCSVKKTTRLRAEGVKV